MQISKIHFTPPLAQMVATPRVVAPQSLSVKFSSSAFTTQPKVSFHGRTTSFLVKNNIPSSVMFVVRHSPDNAPNAEVAARSVTEEG